MADATLLGVHLDDRISYSQDNGIEKTATLFYVVKYDPSTGIPACAIEAETASGVPLWGSACTYDANRFLKSKRASALNPDDSNRYNWVVQCDYSSLVTPNPLALPWAIEWDYSESTAPYFIDHSSLYPGASSSIDQPVVSSAGEPFSDLPERETGSWSATATKNFLPTYTIANQINTMQGVNASAFTFDGQTIAQYAAKISGGHLGSTQIQNGTSYRQVTIKLKFKDGGWIDNLEDRGFSQKASSGGGLVPIFTDSTNHIKTDKPWPLDGSGHAKSSASSAGANLVFYPYKPISFGSFSFT